MMKGFIRVSVLVLATSLVACGPRGETHTLDEVLNDARQRFSQEQTGALPAEVQTALKDIATKLQSSVQSPQDLSTQANGIADQLSQLVNHAGFTSRAPMHEMINQYRAIASAHEGEGATAQAKLLASRTYSLLASEMEGISFRLPN